MNNYIILAIVIVFMVVMIYLIVTKQYAKLKEIILGLMLYVEREFTTSPGADKFNIVFKAVYTAYMPKWLKFFISEEQLKEILQSIYDQAKILLQTKEKRIVKR